MASQVIGSSAVAVHMYQALYGGAPSNTLYNSYISVINTSGSSAFAQQMADSFASTSDASLASTVLTNFGITSTSIATASYDALYAAVQQAFAAYPTARGQVILNMSNLLAGLEGDATYGTVATTYNNQALADFNYASNTANTTPGTPAPSGTVTNQTFTLTTGADVVNGGAGDDTITGGRGTLTTVDEIHGGAGTDTLTLALDQSLATANTGVIAPMVSGVENFTVDARATGVINFADIVGVTNLTLGGRSDLALSALTNTLTAVNVNGMSAVLTIDQATATASTAAYGLTLNMSASSGANVVYAEDSNSTALVDTLTIDALGNVQLSAGTAVGGTTTGNLMGVDKLVLKGAGNVTLDLTNGTGWADLTANNTAAGVDASLLTGGLTASFTAGDFNVKGGAGADTFSMGATLNTNDTLDGGAGVDTLNASIGGYLRPIVNNVETFNLQVTSAATADFRDVSGANTVNLMLASAGALVDKAGSSVTTVTVNSAAGTAADLTVRYGSAAVASNVTLNLANGVQGVQQTAAATATAMALNNVSFSGNSGSFTLKAAGTANYSMETVSAQDFTAVTLDAASASITVSGNASFAQAQTLTLQAAAAKGIVANGDVSAMLANSVTLAANGASASIDVGTAKLGTANTLTITTDTAMTGNLGVSANELVFQSAAATGAVNLDTITINALGGDVSIGTANFLSAATSVNLSMNVAMGSTGVAVTLGQLSLNDIATAATASEQQVSLRLSGSGSFVLNSATIASGNVTFAVNATALASGSNVTINLSKVDDTGSTVSAVFGAASGTYVGADGVDNIEFGLGDVVVDGGLGNDQITMSNTAANRVRLSAAASGNLAGLDTIIGAGAGDVIIFAGGGTATASYSGGNAPSTGTATTAGDFRTTSFSAQATADSTALDQIAIYTSNGDTIIQVLTQATATGATIVSGVDYAQVTLSNKDFTAITAAFKLDVTGSGLAITLL